MGGYVGSAPAYNGSSLGSSPDISQKWATQAKEEIGIGKETEPT
jgi:hypothetical protein